MKLWKKIKIYYYWLRGYPVLFHDVGIVYLTPPSKEEQFKKMRDEIEDSILRLWGKEAAKCLR